MKPVILWGTANPAMARLVGDEVGVEPTTCNVERFPDGELRPTVGDIGDGDVYIIQPTGPPVNDNMIELLLIIDACRLAGAGRITAVVPYLGYARQDRRNTEGQPVGAQVIVSAIASAGADRLVVVDPHTTAIEQMSPIPVAMLTGVPLIASALKELIAGNTVVVAPDLGAVGLAEHYGFLLGTPFAVVQKTRISGSEVAVETVTGTVSDRHVLIVDDMISTGATIAAAAQAVLERGALTDLVVAATHGLLLRPHIERLGSIPIKKVWITDSLPHPDLEALPTQVVTIAPFIADAVERLHLQKSLDGLLVRGDLSRELNS